MTKRPRSPGTDSSSESSSTHSQSPARSASPARKQPILDTSSQPSHTTSQEPLIYCDLPPHRHPLSFTTYAAYEAHHNAHHTNRCLECRHNFPSSHFLHLHIAENHDTITEARRARGEKIYACFVEDCDKVCATWEKRRMHLVDKHFFPKNYDFFIVNDGVDGRTSMLRPAGRGRRSKQVVQQAVVQEDEGENGSGNEADAESQSRERDLGSSRSLRKARGEVGHRFVVRESVQSSDDGVDGLTRSLSALKFVPPSVRFGRRRGGAAFSRT